MPSPFNSHGEKGVCKHGSGEHHKSPCSVLGIPLLRPCFGASSRALPLRAPQRLEKEHGWNREAKASSAPNNHAANLHFWVQSGPPGSGRRGVISTGRFYFSPWGKWESLWPEGEEGRLRFEPSGRSPGRTPTYFKKGPHGLMITMILIQTHICLFLMAWSREGEKREGFDAVLFTF